MRDLVILFVHPILSMEISLPRPVLNTDSCLISTDLRRWNVPVNPAQLSFLILPLDQLCSLAGWTVRRWAFL